MNHVERFRAVMNFEPVDRRPRWEWAMWWDQTIERWHGEGLPKEYHFSQVVDHGYGRRCDDAGAMASGDRRERRAASRTTGRRGRHETAETISGAFFVGHFDKMTMNRG